MKKKELMQNLDPARIVEAIHRAEQACSGEIRVHLDPKLHGRDIRTVAERTFERLGMTRTTRRNGVLLYIAAEEQEFTILGDQGINDRVGPGFWDAVAARLMERFKSEQFTEGIVEAVEMVGAQLSANFPRQAGDVNELANEVTFGSDESHDPGSDLPRQ